MFDRKKKFDSKIRFQNRNFKSQLRQARGYRRTVRKIPQGTWQFFLSKLGLGTIYAKILSAAALLFLIYFLFLPNFLSVKAIQINNAPRDLQSQTQNAVQNFLSRNRIWGQTNLLLLSTSSLSKYLLRHNPGIETIESLEKKFPHTLVLTLKPRRAQYLLSANSQELVVSSDGVILKQLDPLATSSETSALLPFLLQQATSTELSGKIFSTDYLTALNALNAKLPSITNSQINGFSASGLEDPNLEANLSAGYKIMFSIKSDLGNTLNQLSLLLGNLTGNDIKKLYYIDMRIQNRSYVCYRQTACAAPPLPPATSTPETLTNPNNNNPAQ